MPEQSILVENLDKTVEMSTEDYVLIQTTRGTELIKKKHLISGLEDLGILPLSSSGSTISILNTGYSMNIEANVHSLIALSSTLPPQSSAVYSFVTSRIQPVNSAITAVALSSYSSITALSANLTILSAHSLSSITSLTARSNAAITAINSLQLSATNDKNRLDSIDGKISALSARSYFGFENSGNIYTLTASTWVIDINDSIPDFPIVADTLYALEGTFLARDPITGRGSYDVDCGFLYTSPTSAISIYDNTATKFSPGHLGTLIFSIASDLPILTYTGSVGDKISYNLQLLKV